LLLVLFVSASVAGVRAQNENAPAASPGAERELDARRRGTGGLLRVLNLTPEQRAQIVAIRRETEPQGRLLGMRLRQARRALDEAIYSANPDESVIEDRVRELGVAQTAVVRLRSLTELRIRRVLSLAQLEAFRRLQRQTRTRPRRMNQLPAEQDDLPGDAPARFGNRMQRRARERRQQRRLLNEQNAPSDRRAPGPAPSRDRRP
jgi:Spy/CpxP family protein refolding chaperone